MRQGPRASASHRGLTGETPRERAQIAAAYLREAAAKRAAGPEARTPRTEREHLEAVVVYRDPHVW